MDLFEIHNGFMIKEACFKKGMFTEKVYRSMILAKPFYDFSKIMNAFTKEGFQENVANMFINKYLCHD
jgi:hypothetical protein